GIGGNLRNSICAVAVADGRFSLTKDATVISYGASADAILATARRAPDAAHSDQVMVVIPDDGNRSLDRKSVWDTLGMRGTCSDGFLLTATGEAAQIFPKPFSEIAAQSMLASSHIYWAATWFGIAADAFARAQAFVKAAARKQPNVTPPGALRLSEAAAKLQEMKGHLVAAIHRFDAAQQSDDDLSSIGFAAEINAEKPGAAIALAADVRDFASVQALAEQAKAGIGAVDILVNNAGNAGPTNAGLTGKPFWEQDPAEWDAWIGVNFVGVLNCCRAFLP
ncbi:MAG: SDR family NAD(P)-dependent oxidoreductase, partial [Rhizobiales bacterium]|nr:SDR family NAD(P)-dependent oxidoreductase [Hyphomicrobiales bacterium]